MIRAISLSMNYKTIRAITLASFFTSLILLTINIFAFNRFFTNSITSIPVTVYILTFTSSVLLLASMMYACICIITLLKIFSINYKLKTPLPALVIPIYVSYICMCIAFEMLATFKANTTLYIIMHLELPVLAVLTLCILLVYYIESILNQTRVARAAHNMPLNNSITTIDSGYTTCASYSNSQSNISYDEVSLSIPPDPHEELQHIPYIDSFGSQEDMRTAMTTSV